MSRSPIDTTMTADERINRRLRDLDAARYRISVPNATGVAGPEGPPGAAGSQIRSGTGVPSNALGVNGDYYLRTTTDDLYFKAAGVYTILVNLKGEKGETGTNGTNGAPGLTWKGTWSSGTTYAENDAVTLKGSSWRSKKGSNKEHEPPNTEWWEILAEGGAATTVEELLNSKGVGYVKYGTNLATARPTGFKMVIWEGMGGEPTNATAEDLIVPENASGTFVPAARVYKATGQSIGAGAFGVLTFDSEQYDNAGIHSTVSNTERLVAPKSGVYLATVATGLLPGANQIGYLFMTKNGTTNLAINRFGVEPNGLWENELATIVQLNAGDYITCSVFNSAASAKTTQYGGQHPQEASLTWLGTGLKSEPVDWGIVTTLPAEPTEGDTCTFKVETGVYWELKYTGEATYPWAKIGGPPIYKADMAARETSSETKTESSATKITAPLAMEADIEWGCGLAAVQEAALSAGRLAIYKNATTELDWAAMAGSSTFDGASLYKTNRNTLAKSDTIADFYRVEIAGKKVKFTNLWLKVNPVRVG